jgi:hypothetical protein
MAEVMSKSGWRCGCCGEWHAELPLHYGAAAPALWYAIPEGERAARAELSTDLCLIDGEHGFIVGNLEIPVRETGEIFSWDVWVSLSQTNFKRTLELREQPGREAEPPYFGWLSTSLPCYPETLHLKTLVHTRAAGRRPRVELEPTDHPLAVEQREGMTVERVREIAEGVLHGDGGEGATVG